MLRTIVALAATVMLAGCSSTLQDLEDVHAVEPDVVQVYYSPDQFPNVLIACPDGREDWGYMITTREYQDPIMFETCPIDGERGDVIGGSPSLE
jgi:hypothetical protein